MDTSIPKLVDRCSADPSFSSGLCILRGKPFIDLLQHNLLGGWKQQAHLCSHQLSTPKSSTGNPGTVLVMAKRSLRSNQHRSRAPRPVPAPLLGSLVASEQASGMPPASLGRSELGSGRRTEDGGRSSLPRTEHGASK